jgi:hypothetical protein
MPPDDVEVLISNYYLKTNSGVCAAFLGVSARPNNFGPRLLDVGYVDAELQIEPCFLCRKMTASTWFLC